MRQPVKISDELIHDARLTAEVVERSIADQIELWAQLGRAVEPYEAARLADALRRALVWRAERFVFETVLSDPVGDKIAFLEEAAGRGYVVVWSYNGLSGPNQSVERVAMRVSQGGHDVPDDKLRSRFSRSIANLHAAIARLPDVLIYDKSDLNVPYRQLAVFNQGQVRGLQEPLPEWLRPFLP